jgi:hypothetical protein
VLYIKKFLPKPSIVAKLLIIQPWFGAVGHPAQSLINMACAIGKKEDVHYLVSLNNSPDSSMNSMERLKVLGDVSSFTVSTPSGRSNTIIALFKLVSLKIRGYRYQRLFFFDASLMALAFFWPVFSRVLLVDRISVLYLQGPESISESWLYRWIINRFLMRSEVKLYLRTEELAKAWTNSFTVTGGPISHLPSLEIPDGDEVVQQDVLLPSEQLKFGIIGQVRGGKGIDWLVPIFQEEPAIGKLTIAGAFYNHKCHEQLSLLDEFEGFIECFMPEEMMLKLAAQQDYLLMLYDGIWDPRMESAILYLAARVNRPVVVYGASWSGRMVHEYRCGVLASKDRKEAVELFKRLPRPGSAGYTELLNGMNAFKRAHSVEALRSVVLQELLG